MSSAIGLGIPKKLTEQERSSLLAPLNSRGWNKVHSNRDAIQKSFQFKDFQSAFGFMTRVAISSEKMDHHPEVSFDLTFDESRNSFRDKVVQCIQSS
jgi:pterin-4a-carbinolamine dehydratase